jgi:hypothetical protein
MKKMIAIVIGLGLAVGAVSFAQDKATKAKTTKAKSTKKAKSTAKM